MAATPGLKFLQGKGVAVTLGIGILTSMFTAIMGTRAIINLVYGGRRVKTLSIGGVKVGK